MIGVVGDLHGDPYALAEILARGTFQKGDLLIVLGDFGFILRNTYGEDLFLDDFEANCGPTLAFLSGNHENHPVIARYPVENWCSGKIHRIRKNIVHLMNGEIYDFGPGKQCFVMGGAYSRDKGLNPARIATQWLRVDRTEDGACFCFESSEDPDFEAKGEGVETVTDRETCYRFIDGLYQALLPAVRRGFPKGYRDYCELRHSNRDGKKTAQSKRIEEILSLSCGEREPYRKEFAELMFSLLPDGNSFRLKINEGGWWKEELPGPEDYKNASENLKKHGMKVDYILSHTMPREIILRYGRNPDPHDAELTGFLEWVMYECSFRHHYFGHWHDDASIGDRHTAVFRKIHIL